MSGLISTQLRSTPSGIRTFYAFTIVAVLAYGKSPGQSRILDGTLNYLRNGDTREWATFPATVNDKELNLAFGIADKMKNMTLSLRQFDVKQNWRVLLNDQDVGGLVEDEKDMIVYFELPPAFLRAGVNNLVIRAENNTPDDIRVGNIILHDRAMKDVIYIQRVNTKGGVAPADACNDSMKGAKKTVPYSADYVFYKAG